ncbi:MAG: UDP-N-acetylglucosamine--N-acetylmuramyl-(pentapeptide) pyrophosphoryl-undecaprenol N-acetylglucosamine transferase [Candidatus Xiphinematobacter sp.]|nr:MAG: UDP-N-acetylglucosamine--N-acetylmuramyl-(pentapeptide) pyrophosphoryl-undecaprenol N-acetylglucosamine transferase [Candidatus Xiphinematobacter sp.]
MKIAIACGGSGGHLFPGLAVAKALSERNHEVLLLISEKKIDSVALQAHSEFLVEKLPPISFPSALSPTFIQFLRFAWKSLAKCNRILVHYQPRVVLGMGGSTSAALVVTARVAGILSCVHESNSIPGRANRLGAKLASHVLLGFAECRAHFPRVECTVTGIPIRMTLTRRIPRAQALTDLHLDPLRKTLLVIGGSQGASSINQLLSHTAPLLRNMHLQIIHLVGREDGCSLAANYSRENIPAYVAVFHHRMEQVFSSADLVISRAGASTLSEISHFGLASVLIPYPFARDNHQESNAAVFVRATAAEMLLESDATPEILTRLIMDLLNDECRRQCMAQRAREVFPRDSSQRVVSTIEKIGE